MYENILSIIASVLFHAVLALIFLLNLQQTPIAEQKQYEVVDAIAIDESKLLATLGSNKATELKAELQSQWEQQQRLAAIRYEKLKQEEQRLEKIRLEQERLKELERQKQLEQERKALEQQQLREQQELAKLRQKQAELKEQARKAEQKRLALEKEAKRKAAAKALEKQRTEQAAQLEQQRQQAAQRAEIERQLAKQRQAAQEAELKRQLDAKRKAVEDERVVRVIHMIRQRVQQVWQHPAYSAAHLTCRITVKLAADGIVTQAYVTTSSGHTAFDSSAVSAVYRASPLPIAQDLYPHFKSFTFTFRPQ